MPMNKERWLPIAGYESLYKVSSQGRIANARTDKPLTPQPQNGYRTIILRSGGRRKAYMVHVLVARAFIGPPPPGTEVNHKDTVRDNNVETNLEYLTRSQNIRHAMETRGSYRGSRHPQAKLDETKVVDIQKLVEAGVPRKVLAAKYAVSLSTIDRVAQGVGWRHVDGNG